MELRYLQEFVTLEKIRNFTNAADALYTTEASLSRHIKTLEKELQHQLFQRTTRRVELTEFGRKFLVYAEKFVKIGEELETNLLKKDSHEGDRLMIGIFGPIVHYTLIQEALRNFSACSPNCTIGTIQGDLTQLKDKLQKREYDLSIVRESAAASDDVFDRVPLLQEPLCVVLPKSDPLSRQDEVDVASLKGKVVTIPSEFMLAHRLYVELCRHNGFEPKVKSLLREREFMGNFVSVGSGITVLSENMANRSFNPNTQVVKKLSPLTYEYVNLLFLKTETRTETMKNAIRCFEEARRLTGNERE